jgi:hypothetical protein
MFLALSPSLLLLFVLTALSALIFSLMDMTQPAPYMDEIFHVPQAKHYCNGNFKVVRALTNRNKLKSFVA